MIEVVVAHRHVRQPRPGHGVSGEAMQRPRPAIEQDPKTLSFDQVRRRGSGRIGKQGPGAEYPDDRHRAPELEAAPATSRASSSLTPTMVLTPGSSIVTP